MCSLQQRKLLGVDISSLLIKKTKLPLFKH